MRLSLVLERDSDPIRGSLQSLDGEPQQFEGWMELAVVLEALIDHQDAAADR